MKKEIRTPTLFQDSELRITQQHIAQKGQYAFEYHIQEHLGFYKATVI